MKKILFTTLLTAGVCMAMISCNNGAYDADPNTDNATIKNPLDPNSGVTVYIGTIKTVLNGKDVLFTDCSYTIDTNNNRIITGVQANDNVFNSAIRIYFAESTYKGPGTYN